MGIEMSEKPFNVKPSSEKKKSEDTRTKVKLMAEKL